MAACEETNWVAGKSDEFHEQRDSMELQPVAMAENEAARSVCQAIVDARSETGKMVEAREKFKPSEEALAQVKELLDIAQQCRDEGYSDDDMVETLNGFLEELDDENRGYAREMFLEHFGLDCAVGQNSNQTGSDSRIQQAIAELQQAEADSRNDAEDFEQIKFHSMNYDEQGRKISGDDKGTSFHTEHSDLRFADMIRPQVFSIVRYLGSFKVFMTSELFVDDRKNDTPFFRASAKVPFLFTHYGCTKIQARLMHKYLENPFNPAILASYQLGMKLQAALQGGGQGVERTIHLADAYLKMRSEKPYLVCVGPPGARKSTLLNSLFGLQFETLQNGALGLFHDGAEVVFDSESFPAGFNVVDMQGFASEDTALLEMLLTRMPRSLLLVLLSDVDYVEKILGNLPEGVRAGLAERTFVLLRLSDQKKSVQARAKNKVIKAFGHSVTMFELGDETAGEAYMMSQLQKALFQIQSFVEKKEDALERQRSDLLLAAQTVCDSTEALAGLQGSFWLTFDQMSRLSSCPSGFRIQQLPKMFRERHVRMKKLLQGTSPAKMERAEVFPCYSQYLELVKNRKELEDRDILKEARVKTLEKRIEELEGKKAIPSDIFNLWLESYMERDTHEYPDICADLMALVEAAYLPRIKSARDKLFEAKSSMAKNSNKLGELKGKMEANPTPEQLTTLHEEHKRYEKEMEEAKKTLQSALEEMESKVLDSELFFREAKHAFEEGSEQHAKLIERLGRDFQAGRPLEIIDGDSNKVDKETLVSVFEWVHSLQKNSRKLVVVTIIGPQSSGKSTLLNYLFGAKFHVSAGRCTKGLNAMLLRTDLDEVKEVLILDSEGIFSIEKQDPTYDRKLAIFCMSVSNVLLINIKGELSAEVQKVMEVAIYACTKIVESRAALKVPKIMFVLRDQNSGDTALVETAYSKLKSQVRAAAEASGTLLETVLDMPEHGRDILFLFKAALIPTKVNNSSSLELTESNGGFRDQCARLRWQLLNSCKMLKEEEKADNLVSWIKDASSVWTAVQEQEQLSMITDLKEINNHRNLIKALEGFGTIMSTLGQQDGPPRTHPLLIHSQDADEKDRLLPPGKTVFQKFSIKIDAMLDQQKEHDAKKMQNLRTQQEVEMRKLMDELTKEEVDHAHEFTKEFGPNLRRQAESSVRHMVENIYQKAMTRWKRETASKTIDDAAQGMLERLKMLVFDSKRQGKQLSKQQFQKEAEKGMQQTESELEHFSKKKSQICDEAFRDLEEIAGSGDSDSFSFFQFKELQSNKVPKPTLLDAADAKICLEWRGGQGGDSLMWGRGVPSGMKGQFSGGVQDSKGNFSTYFSVDKNIMETAVASYVDNKSTKQDDGKASLFKFWDKSTKQDDEKARCKAEVLETVLEIERVRFDNLRESVQECMLWMKDANSKSDSPQPLLDKARARLFEVFNKALEGMAHKSAVRASSIEELAKQCTSHNLKEWQQLFTRVYFNRLHDQVERNESLHKRHMVMKLQSKKDEAIEFFDEINQRVEGTQGCSGVLMKVLVEAVSTVLEQSVKADLERDLINLTIVKSEVMKKAREKFEAADSSEEGKKTIIDFMKNPIELEERIVRAQYDQQTEDRKKHHLKMYEDNIEKAITTIEEFFVQLTQQLFDQRTDTEQVSDIGPDEGTKKKRNETVLQYLYWSVLWQLQNVGSATEGTGRRRESGQDKAKKLRELVESYEIWGKRIGFPDVGKRIFRIDPDTYNATMDQKHLVDLSGTLKYEDMTVFMMSLSDIRRNEQVKQKLQTAREKFSSAMSSVVSNNDYASFQKRGIGCRGECYFCGARCSEPTECAGGCYHKSDFHRPMAFKGSYSEKDGKKHLLQDCCTSPTNIKSLWPAKKQSSDGGGNIVDALRRCEELDLKTDCMNVYLEWETTADLDINVMCACGLWHGYGTTGGSEGTCLCKVCGMHRDHDVREASPRTVKAIEHVYFEDTKKLVDKEIGVAVYNYSDSSGSRHNPFNLCIFNQWAHQLFPNPGAEEARYEATWMFTGEPKTTSAKKFYKVKAADEHLGREKRFVQFPRHVEDLGLPWAFSEANTADLKNNAEFKRFIQKCNEKWKIVKKEMCAGYKAEELEKVMVI